MAYGRPLGSPLTIRRAPIFNKQSTFDGPSILSHRQKDSYFANLNILLYWNSKIFVARFGDPMSHQRLPTIFLFHCIVALSDQGHQHLPNFVAPAVHRVYCHNAFKITNRVHFYIALTDVCYRPSVHCRSAFEDIFNFSWDASKKFNRSGMKTTSKFP